MDGCRYMVTMFIAVVWLAILADVMSEFAEAVGCLFGVSEAIMGLTVTAAGTSLPNLFASVIVAKQGLARSPLAPRRTSVHSVNSGTNAQPLSPPSLHAGEYVGFQRVRQQHLQHFHCTRTTVDRGLLLPESLGILRGSRGCVPVPARPAAAAAAAAATAAAAAGYQTV